MTYALNRLDLLEARPVLEQSFDRFAHEMTQKLIDVLELTVEQADGSRSMTTTELQNLTPIGSIRP